MTHGIEDDDEQDPEARAALAEIKIFDGVTKVIANVEAASERTYPIHRKSFVEKWCDHAQAQLDEHARVVRCQACKVVLDPIEVLDKLAREVEWVDHLRHEKAELREEISKLKVERQRLKSAVRSSAKRRAANAAAQVVEGVIAVENLTQKALPKKKRMLRRKAP